MLMSRRVNSKRGGAEGQRYLQLHVNEEIPREKYTFGCFTGNFLVD